MRFTCDAAFESEVFLCADKISNGALGRKHTVTEACVRHWRSIKPKLFSSLTNRKSFLDQVKEEIARLMPLF
jgi:hypothetical protein